MSQDELVRKSIESCQTAQAMIDINAQHLDGLRTECATSAELTQIEIRTLEVDEHFKFFKPSISVFCVIDFVFHAISFHADIAFMLHHLFSLTSSKYSYVTFQSKLVKLFSRQLVARYKCPNGNNNSHLQPYPQLRLWLRVVGLSNTTIEVWKV